MSTPKKWTYYIVIEYSRGWFGWQVTESAIVDLDAPLTSLAGVKAAMSWLREDYPDAILRWWTLLNDEENNDSET